MKTKHIFSFVKFSAITIIISLFFIQCSSSKKTGDNHDKLNDDDVKSMANNQAFIFVADRVNPLRGATRILTSEYDVTVKKDSLISYLPYFGRAYQAPVNPSEGGIQFTSTNFSYEINANKSNSWDVIIKPKDYHDVQEFSFSIFDNGRATLNVISTHKDPISFSGYIQKIRNAE